MNATYKLVSKGCVRYIGTTYQSLETRLKEHFKEVRGRKRNHRLNWLRSLEEAPTIELVEETTPETWAASERYWIALARDYGCRLVNATPGGEGFGSGPQHPGFGKPLSTEHRAKLSAAKAGKPNGRLGKPSPIKGRTFSAVVRANMSAARTGNTNSLGHVHSPEARANMKAAQVARRAREKKAL